MTTWTLKHRQEQETMMDSITLNLGTQLERNDLVVCQQDNAS